MSRQHLCAFVVAAMIAVGSGCAETPDHSQDASQPGINISPEITLPLMESGPAGSFYIALTSPTSEALDISITANHPEKVAISANKISGYFYPNPKSIEVRCIDDYVNDGDEDVELTFSITGNDVQYQGISLTRTVRCQENPAVPTREAQDDFCPDNPDKTTPGVCGCNMPDTPENTAILSDGYPQCLTHSAALGFYDDDNELSILEPDDAFLTELGDSQIFAVALSAKPAADVVVPIESSDPTEGTADVTELVFTPENWNDPQFVTVTGANDDEVDGDAYFSLFIGPAQSEDKSFDGVTSEPLTFVNMDDEDPVADLVISSTDISVHEGGVSSELYVKLAKAPMEGENVEVNVHFESSDRKEIVVTPEVLTFDAENWDDPQVVLLRAFKDKYEDGNKNVEITITSDSNEECGEALCYRDRTYDKVNVTVVDSTLSAAEAAKKTANIRIMAANITSGSAQSYDPGHGIHIFRAAKPDIVLIQEFNYNKDSIANFVKSTFGEEYSYTRGKGAIPNGIISRYPILQSGSWESNRVVNREWDWAVIDIPGDRDLLAVSVHLHTEDNAIEMGPLRTRIDKKIDSDGRDYYVVIGGDFNQPNWSPIRSNFGSLFTVGKSYADWPMDQLGQITTNAKRVKQYDYLLCSTEFCKYETPVVIGEHSYPKGHVIDSRVYNKKGELKTFEPVQAKDSGATNMQHMAVIRDFKYRYAD